VFHVGAIFAVAALLSALSGSVGGSTRSRVAQPAETHSDW
jgi:hypothetical protein